MAADVDIETVHPFDDAALRDWHDVYLRAETFDRAAPAAWQYAEVAAEARTDSTQFRQAYFLGRIGGQAVTSASITADTLANRHVVRVQLHTAPEHRRRGFASTLLTYVEHAARGWGCTTAVAEASWRPGLGETGDGDPGREFARRHGYELGLAYLQRRLALPVDPELLARLADEAAAAYRGAYVLRSWTGPVPDELAEGVARLQARVDTEAPMGGLEFEEESPDVEAMRDRERIQAEQGRTKYGVAALRTTGAVAAYSDLVTTVHEPGVAYQWGTLVEREDRGHRLGLAVKTANVSRLMAERPDIATLITFNAVSNTHMVAINDALGFVPVEYLGEFQKRS